MPRMGTLHLVRHGQASFGSDDYDRLSELGERQCHALGAWFAGRGVRFDGVMHGTLKRHRQSLAAIRQGHGDLPEALTWPGLDEYDAAAVVRAVHPDPLPPPTTPEAFKHHFRVLREGLARWMAGEAAPEGMPSYADWVAGVEGALDHVRENFAGDVLVVSSGGPIATAVGRVLGTSAETTIDLNMQIRNSALTEFVFTPRRVILVGYNHLPHLDQRPDWVTRT